MSLLIVIPLILASAKSSDQKLVGGAPLYSPNVAVHIVERKLFADEAKHELILFPLTAQANGRFTQHFGSAASYVYHLQENFALSLFGQYNWYSNESSFNQELIEKMRQEVQQASSLLLQGGILAGFEVAP